jgi:hypothetical protein
MLAPLPFEVSIEVEKWLSQIPPLPDKQPGLSCSPRYGVYKGDQLVEEFSREYYVVAHTSTEAWLAVNAVQVVIGARTFWIEPNALDKLRGKTLTLIRTDVSRIQDDPKIRAFLISA